MPEPRPRTPGRRSKRSPAGRAARTAALLLAFHLAQRSAGGAPPQAVPDDAVLESSGAVVGRITLRLGNVFDPSDPAEDNPVFRAANFVHIKTRESVIRRNLLFREGDRYSRRVLEESERLLRGLGTLYDARIRPVRYEGGAVDVEVTTRDVWTLRPGLNFGRGGGVNRVRIGIEETNLLGRGKSVAVHRTRDVDRISETYAYTDPAVLGSRSRFALRYSDNSDGEGRAALLERPFYALDTRWAAGLSFDREDRVESLYDLGHVVDRFRHENLGVSGWAGFSRGLVGGRANRWTAGFTYDEQTFGSVPGTTPPGSAPSDRTLSYPWIAVDSVQDRFITVRDLDKIQRTEDLNLAQEVHASLGWAAPAFGSDRGRVLFSGSYEVGLSPRAGQMLFVTTAISGRRAGSGFESVVAEAGTRFFVRDLGRHLFYASLDVAAAHHLDGERQILLGGDNGLRGYPLRYQDGDRRFLLTVEQRFYSDWHVLELFRVGAALFFDVGSAWFAGSGDPSSLGALRDVGCGLRLASSRSARAAMTHVDVAFPLDGDRTIRRIQFLVSTHETF
jgi:hypothetical protein